MLVNTFHVLLPRYFNRSAEFSILILAPSPYFICFSIEFTFRGVFERFVIFLFIYYFQFYSSVSRDCMNFITSMSGVQTWAISLLQVYISFQQNSYRSSMENNILILNITKTLDLLLFQTRVSDFAVISKTLFITKISLGLSFQN